MGSMRTRPFIPRTSVFVRVFQTLEVTIFGSFRTSLFIPRTSVFVRVFQTLEVTIPCSIRTSLFIPRTSVFARVFQTLEVTIFGSFKTSPNIPRTPVFVQMLKQIFVSIPSHSCTKSFPPFRTLLQSPRYGRRRIEISNLESITQTHLRPFYRHSTFPINVVKEFHVVPIQLRHDVRIKYIRMIRHEFP